MPSSCPSRATARGVPPAFAIVSAIACASRTVSRLIALSSLRTAPVGVTDVDDVFK